MTRFMGRAEVRLAAHILRLGLHEPGILREEWKVPADALTEHSRVKWALKALLPHQICEVEYVS